MYCNFTYNGTTSASKSVICVSIDSSSAVEKSSLASTDINQEKALRSNKFQLVSQEYNKPISFTIQIINSDGSEMSVTKQRQIIAWLCLKNQYAWLQIDDNDYSGINYHVNISNPQIISIGKVIGIEFTVTSDAPYAFSDEITVNKTLESSNGTALLTITTDDNDYIYPLITVTLSDAGDFSISNSTDTNTFDVDDVVAGEVLIINNELPLLSTSSITHNVYGDFNKNWIRLINGANTLTFNLPCVVVIKYREVRKVGVV